MIVAYLCVWKILGTLQSKVNTKVSDLTNIFLLGHCLSVSVTGIIIFLDTVQPSEKEVGKVIKSLNSRFSFTVMKKKLLEPSFFISERQIVCFLSKMQ